MLYDAMCIDQYRQKHEIEKNGDDQMPNLTLARRK